MDVEFHALVAFHSRIHHMPMPPFLARVCDRFLTQTLPLETYMMVTLKLMTPILLRWSTTSEADVGDMAAEVGPSRQYSVKFCCHATDDSRGAV